jgi:hypothetical protein
MSTIRIEKSGSNYEENFVDLEVSSGTEIARLLLAGLGTMLFLGAASYMVAFFLSAVLLALLS